MGKALTYKKASENLDIIINLIKSKGIENDFSPLNSTLVELTVLAEVSGKVVANNVFPVRFSYRENYAGSRANSDFYDIHIHWEDNKRDNFRSIGLFGIYSTDYNEIQFDKVLQQLHIFGDNNSKVTIFFE